MIILRPRPSAPSIDIETVGTTGVPTYAPAGNVETARSGAGRACLISSYETCPRICQVASNRDLPENGWSKDGPARQELILSGYNQLLRLFLAVGLLSLLLLTGCSRTPEIVSEQVRALEPDPYEILWVDPQIVLTDTLITLIHANRIDSVLATPQELARRRPASIELHISETSCNVSATLVDSDLQTIYPLLVRRLPTGYYRLTVNLGRFNQPLLPPGGYFLRADYCGRTELAAISVD